MSAKSLSPLGSVDSAMDSSLAFSLTFILAHHQDNHLLQHTLITARTIINLQIPLKHSLAPRKLLTHCLPVSEQDPYIIPDTEFLDLARKNILGMYSTTLVGYTKRLF